MNKEKKQPRTRFTLILLCVILLVQTAFILYQIHLRQGYFLDEFFTYGLANSYELPFLGSGKNLITDSWQDSDTFHKYLSVQRGQRFSFSNVYRNEMQDAHPPVYSMLVHAVCSFFPDSFSKWYGEFVNIAAFVLTGVFLFLLARRFFSDDVLALSVNLLYGGSLLAVDTAVYIRMYMLLTMWAVISFYLHHRVLTEARLKPSLAAGLFFTTWLGCLTQYYFLILSFFLAAVVCVYFFFRKNYRTLIRYAVCMLSSVGAVILAFPVMFNQLFAGDMGGRTLSNLSAFRALLYRSKAFVLITAPMLFQNNASVTAAVAVCTGLLACIAGVIFLFVQKKKPAFLQTPDNRIWADLMIMVSSLPTFAAVSLISVYISERYLYFLIPVLCVAVVGVPYLSLKTLLKNRKAVPIIIALLCAANCACTFVFCDSSFLVFNQKTKNQAILKEYAGLYAVVFSGEDLTDIVTQELFEIDEMAAFYSTHYRNSASIDEILGERDTGDGIVVWIDNRADRLQDLTVETVLSNILSGSRFLGYKLLYSYHLADVYYFY